MSTFQPRVCYDDCTTAVEWLERAFGFLPVMVATRDGAVVSADMSFCGGRLTIGGAWENIKSPAEVGGANTQIIHVMVESNVDAHCERARAAGAIIVQEPADMFHGERTYRALDPQGHMWIFGNKVRDMTAAELEAVLPGMKITMRE